ncbi:MAG: hypothetical protein P8184_02560 [Calditrichia bacterium]
MKTRILMMFTLGLIALLAFSCSSKKQENETAGNNETAGKIEAHSGSLPSGQLMFTAQKGWIEEKPSSSMRKAQYSLPGVNGQENATMAVFFFPGTGGSVEQNLQRWYGQFKEPDGSPVTDHVERKQVNVNNLPVTEVYVTGTFLQSQSTMMMGGPVEEKTGYAMWAAIAETAEGPWFFKATGPQETIDHWRKSLNDFAKTFHVQNS